MYDKHIIDQVCYCKDNKDKLVELPITLSTNGLFSNKQLLDKYHKDIPKTCNELINTSKEILEKERALNNTELVGYNGLMNDAELGICSLYEFFYSCRESYDSSFPDLTNKIFKSDMSYSFDLLLVSGNAIFIKFYIFLAKFLGDYSPFVLTEIPGKQKGLSGSILSGYDIGIDNSIDRKKVDSAIEVIKFMTSKEFQKELILKQIIMSGILTLYEDEEVCSSIKFCEYYKNFQGVLKPVDKTDNFDEYSKKFTSYFYEYLYGNETVLNTLKAIDDITKIYNISFNSKENHIGLIILIILITTSILIISSLVFLYLNKFKNAFNFLSKSH
eukprot:jgi/Orpsp1_1/1184225/evm.model.c7180000088615.1